MQAAGDARTVAFKAQAKKSVQFRPAVIDATAAAPLEQA